MAQEIPDIAISKDSVKLSYRRYLSDSSAGFIFLLSLIWIFYKDFEGIAKALPSEVLVFTGLMLFLLATPIGIFINVISWFFLEGRQEVLERRIVSGKLKIPARLTPTLDFLQDEYLFAETKSAFGLNEKNLRSTYEKLRTHLEIKYPSIVAAVEPVRGFTIFLRNIVFLLTVSISYNAVAYVWSNWSHLDFVILLLYLLAFLLPGLFLRLSALTVFYYHAQVFFWAYTLGFTVTNGVVYSPNTAPASKSQSPE
ncbi:MAG: hypothetical protein ACOYYJ_18140 [Chloroflexota bacterium]